jgi:type I restriction enzyme S subunit
LKRLAHYFEERRTKVSDTDYPPLSVTKRGIVPQLETAAKTDDGDNRKLVLAGDFVINSRSDRKGSSGLSDLDGSVSLINTVLEPTSGIHPPFAHHLLRSTAFQEEYYRFGKGIVADLWSTNFSEMRNILLAVPPIEEQVSIALFLDRELAKIDALVDEQRRLIDLLKEEVVSLVLSNYGGPQTTEMRLQQAVDVVSRPVVQEPGQEYRPLGLYNRGRGLFHKEPRAAEEMGDSDFFWVEPGDLIISGQFAWEGAVALAGAEEAGCVVSHRYPVLRGRDGIVLTEYILGLFLTPHGHFLLNEHSRGAAGRNRPLNLNSLLKEKIYVPESHQQIEVSRRIHALARVRAELGAQAALLQERRASLVSAVVTGKIDVRCVASVQAEAA